jgi:hypothetical protein
MKRSNLWPLTLGLSALVAALPLASGCPPSVADDPQNIGDTAEEVTILRFEVDATGLPVGATGVHAQVAAVDVHAKGGWTEHPVDKQFSVSAGQVLTVERVVGSGVDIDMVRISGEFALDIDGEVVPVTVTPARGFQVKFTQPITPGAVNHIRLDLGVALEQKPQGWRLQPSVKAAITAETTTLAAALVTPASGGALELDDGFRLEVPPGAVADATVIHVERVAGTHGTYYLLGPDGLQFALPVTAHVPGSTPEPIVEWSLRPIVGMFDDLGRAVVANTHFSCVERRVEAPAKPLGDHSFAFDGFACGGQYSVVVTELADPRIRVFGGMSPHGPEDGVDGTKCEGRPVYDGVPLPKIFEHKPGYRKVATLPGDIYDCSYANLGNCEVGCPREALTVEGTVISADNASDGSFYLGFDRGSAAGTSVEPQWIAAKDEDDDTPNIPPIPAYNLVNSWYRYAVDGKPDAFPPKPALLVNDTAETFFVWDETPRTSVGFTEGDKFMYLAAAFSADDNGLNGEEWVELLAAPRTITVDGQATEVKMDRAYTMDAGGTTALFYAENGHTWLPQGTSQTADRAVTGLAVYERCHYFDDVPEDAWYFAPAMELVCHGAADAAKSFHPAAGTTRAEYLKYMLELAFPKIPFTADPEAPPFTDVPVDAWYAPYVAFAKTAKIVEGYPDMTFKPLEVITRAEAAKLTVEVGAAPGAEQRFKELHKSYTDLLEDDDVDVEFTDVEWQDMNCPTDGAENSATCWFYHAVYALRDLKAVCGDGQTGLFKPHTPVNRAESAQIACIVAGHCDDCTKQ